MYSTGSSARPAGPGRPGSLGHGSLMDTSFTETLAANDRQEEEKVEIWSVHGSVGFGEEKQREREDESFKTEGGSFIPAPCSSKERGLGICLTGQRTGRSKLKTSTKRKQCQDGVVTLFHVGSEMAP